MHQNNKVEDVEDEVKKYWIKEFYEKKSQLRLFFDRVWYWFIVSLTVILSIGIPVALTILAVNFLPVLLFHMVIEEIILFGVLSTFFGSLAVIGVYYLASLLFSYADKLNDRNNRDNHIDVEKRSPIQRILAGCGFLSFVVATMVVLICLVTFYIDIVAIILLVFLAVCCSSDSHCFICVNCSGGFNVFGLRQSINRPAEAAQCCWNIAVHGRSSLKTREKNYDTLEKLYLRRLKKVFAINRETNEMRLNALISHDIQQNSEFEKLLDKLDDKTYKERLEQQSRFIVLKYKIMPLVVKLADKTGKSADEIFANNILLVGNLSVFDDNVRVNNGANKIYAPASSAQNISNEMRNNMNNDKNENEIELLKKELSLVIKTSVHLFNNFCQSNNNLKQMFKEYKREYNGNLFDPQWFSDYQYMMQNTIVFNIKNNHANNNQYQNYAGFYGAQMGEYQNYVGNGVENNNVNNRYPNYNGFYGAQAGEYQNYVGNGVENNNVNNRYPNYAEFPGDQGVFINMFNANNDLNNQYQNNVDNGVENNNDDDDNGLPTYEEVVAQQSQPKLNRQEKVAKEIPFVYLSESEDKDNNDYTLLH